jgi:hypothetical protein
MKVLVVFGARPEAIELAPAIGGLHERSRARGGGEASQWIVQALVDRGR